MQSLFQTEPTQVEILNFQTFTTEYVAERYGVSTTNIKVHKCEHADEIVESIHFVVDKNDRNRPIIKWTLRGIIKLGMFIRSTESKAFRIWAERELEKIILKQAQEYAQTRARNLALADKVNSLEACAIKDTKDRQNQINGYKGQLAKHNALIASLKTELAEFKPKNGEPRYKTLKTLLEHARKERDFYRKKSIKLENEKRDKELRTFRALQQTKERLDHVFTAIGAIEAYVANDDRFLWNEMKF
nr:MAG TPA: N BRO family, N-terminal domain [Caudoviricetes sp.]